MIELKEIGSMYNWIPDYIAKSKKKDRIIIDDMTLEGDCEEMAGITILGYSPMPPPEEIRTVEKILDLDLPVKIGSFTKTKEEIELAANIGLSYVTILVSVNVDSSYYLGKTGADIIDRCKQLTSLSKDLGLYTVFMGMDSTRTKLNFLKNVVLSVQDYCDEICIGDSRGVISPFGYRYLIEEVGKWTNLPLSVHIHSHSSMAVANALGVVLGGVSVLQTTVNGMGEYSGILPLEEVAVALPMHLGVSTGIKLDKLKSLSDFVARATGVPTSIHKPSVGEYAFAVPETEEIQQSNYERAKKGPIENYGTPPPKLVGNKLRFSIGRKCNKYTVLYNLGINGWTAKPSTIKEIVEAVRRKAYAQKGHYLMEEEDFMKMVKEGEYELIPIKKKLGTK
jgi:isopropylmalate/homocitrate/citramalate synthase